MFVYMPICLFTDIFCIFGDKQFCSLDPEVFKHTEINILSTYGDDFKYSPNLTLHICNVFYYLLHFTKKITTIIVTEPVFMVYYAKKIHKLLVNCKVFNSLVSYLND